MSDSIKRTQIQQFPLSKHQDNWNSLLGNFEACTALLKCINARETWCGDLLLNLAQSSCGDTQLKTHKGFVDCWPRALVQNGRMKHKPLFIYCLPVLMSLTSSQMISECLILIYAKNKNIQAKKKQFTILWLEDKQCNNV